MSKNAKPSRGRLCRRKRKPQLFRPPNRNLPGITFIELIISFALMTLLIIGMTELMVYALTVHDKARFHIKSLALAEAKLEHLKSLPFDHVELEEQTGRELFPEKEGGYLLLWTVEDEAEGLKRIDAVCSASSSSRRKTKVSVYISKELGF